MAYTANKIILPNGQEVEFEIPPMTQDKLGSGKAITKTTESVPVAVDENGQLWVPAGTLGTPGKEIELQNSGTAIQWRYVGGPDWKDVVQLSEITGENRVTPNIQIGEVTTLGPTEQATASVTGTTENPLLNLGIPKGQDGAGGGSEWDYEYTIEVSEPVSVIEHDFPYPMKEIELEGYEPKFAENTTANNYVYAYPKDENGWRRKIGILSIYGETYLYGTFKLVKNSNYMIFYDNGGAITPGIKHNSISAVTIALGTNEENDLFRPGFFLNVRGKKA